MTSTPAHRASLVAQSRRARERTELAQARVRRLVVSSQQCAAATRTALERVPA